MRPRWSLQAVLAVQGGILAVFAVGSLIVLFTSVGTVAEVLVFQMNVLHSVLLLVAALLSVLATLHVRAARWWIGVQAGGFTLLFVIGTAESANRPEDTALALDRADNLGHLALAAVGVGLAAAGPWLGTRSPDGTSKEPLTSGSEGPGPQPVISAHGLTTSGASQFGRRITSIGLESIKRLLPAPLERQSLFDEM